MLKLTELESPVKLNIFEASSNSRSCWSVLSRYLLKSISELSVPNLVKLRRLSDILNACLSVLSSNALKSMIPPDSNVTILVSGL